MLDEPSSSGSSRSHARERALRDARQRLRRLEIETHRIKAELARLESLNETELADQLLAEFRLDGVELATPSARIIEAARPEPSRPWLGRRELPNAAIGPAPAANRAPRSSERPQLPLATTMSIDAPSVTGTPVRQTAPAKPVRKRRKLSPAWSLSLALHAGVLLLLAPMTFVIMTQERIPLFASMFDAPSDVDAPGMAPVELVSFEEFEVPNDALEQATVEAAAALAETFETDFTPLDSSPGGEVAANLGQLNAMPTDVGMLMAGGGGGKAGPLGSGRRGAASDEARIGMTSFFGSQAKANRVVFLVDNSGSMKHGRMETTLFELARSIEALSKEQEFYVVFYSDQAYPMLYPNSEMKPLAATPENKQKLFAWLQTVELCSGGALLKAVDIAESLQPHVVYILSDGDIKGSATLARLTTTSDRKFAIHTLGMGVAKPQDAQNLLAIAQANRGTFQMVRPLPAAVQMAKARPIRSNPFGVSWGEASLQAIR